MFAFIQLQTTRLSIKDLERGHLWVFTSSKILRVMKSISRPRPDRAKPMTAPERKAAAQGTCETTVQ